MTFREATDDLFKRAGHADLAEALGVSVQLVRQARLSQSASAFRQPPEDWRYGAIRLAERRMIELRSLIEKLRGDL